MQRLFETTLTHEDMTRQDKESIKKNQRSGVGTRMGRGEGTTGEETARKRVK